MNWSDSKLHLLVVDDEEKNLRILAAALQDEFTVSTATSGEQALAAAAREPRPDLIVLDVVMPQMHGFDVCEHLKQDLGTNDIPVIFATSLSEDAHEERGLEVGAVDYVTKPYNIPIIKARIRVHTRLKQYERFVDSLARASENAFEETQTKARRLLRQLGNE